MITRTNYQASSLVPSCPMDQAQPIFDEVADPDTAKAGCVVDDESQGQWGCSALDGGNSVAA